MYLFFLILVIYFFREFRWIIGRLRNGRRYGRRNGWWNVVAIEVADALVITLTNSLILAITSLITVIWWTTITVWLAITLIMPAVVLVVTTSTSVILVAAIIATIILGATTTTTIILIIITIAPVEIRISIIAEPI